ncbi:MAG TPA: NADH:ubiquinone oxidoreductase [Marinilabiliales bacterium]|nr:MAG: NADH:ubiquinone oxidoreductase [Bacteroidetes bacterium GWA2_40_14]OFX57540.1 MAG: NADH:ubiquinone oxidoreductase [Bacteroidetes bacterium GWC2_40_13]OFX71437.1 MAG: NADH:ubiquinone oxidoreductase [Bacteroidetes bacterium GWD2_40_43]OFX92686.1 MAG: NADH:ubiquinone oxidoreductase [Bacteroidetes bacterium GWE2_40_63]OFY17591.1 MAG: NADH:ubiquinone oxidoreductase [Bacteroidetes bacterium GWF2_40_13]OFZ28044.1 MAG: NADH:ubiquinone oxidoreductase [Bacteroidetes bacterium RIFOXYC2_FULL_40_12
MEFVNLTIDNKSVKVEKGTSILKAARSVGIDIPTLCYMSLGDMNIENKPGGCRICVVEVEGRRNLAPACCTDAHTDMVIKTNTMRVLNARRTVLELILSDHPADCLICAKSGNCELQTMAHKLGVREIHYKGEMSTYKEDFSPSIIRDMDKCIMCRRCEMMCNEVQTVGALWGVNRGFQAVVSPAFEMDLEKSTCTYCGQCVAVCPTGALTEVDHTNQVIRALADPSKTVVVQTAPAVRAALGEEFGLKPGTLVTGKLAAALRRLGFNFVFDTDFAADLTIMEEGTELLDRLGRHLNGDKEVKLPILTSCCPGWVNFFEKQFPEMKEIPSTARSPQQMFGAIAKTYFAEKIKVNRKDMVVVSVMPCLAKKYECQREEFATDGNPDVDFSISTRELAALIKGANIDFNLLPDEDFDNPLGESTGAAVIFGTTGGVIEAAVRTAYEIQTKKKLEKVDFEELRGLEGVREATIDFNGLPIRIGIAHGLGNARKLLEDIKAGKSYFHAIEIMACPGGCIGGGGQPLHHGDSSILKARQMAIYQEDRNKPIRKSHENPFIVKLYEEFLKHPMSEKAHHLLHTHYFNKKNEFIIE